MEQYFWVVTLIGWLTIAIGLWVFYEVQRRRAARRRAELSAALVAMTGAFREVGAAMEGVAKAAQGATKAFAGFGAAFNREVGRHR